MPVMSPPRVITGDDGDREILCEHGVGHSREGVHTCDGCCAEEGFFDEEQF